MSTSSDPRKRPNGGVPDGGPDAKRRKEHSSSSSSHSHHSHSRPPHSSSSSSSSSSHKKPHSSSSHKHKPSSSSSHKHKSSSSKSKSPAKKHSRGTHVIPTVETNVTVKKKKSEFLCDIDFRNTLPDPPIHPKLLNLYLSHDRLLRYVGSSLEKDHKFDILTELNLGIPIDLIDLDQYIKPENAQLAIEDIRILPQQRDNKKTFMPTKEQLINQKSSNWLRRADILQNNLYDKGNKQVSMIDFAEAEAVRIARLREETLAYNSREKQIERIIETFDLASTDPVHRTNPSLTPVQILDILPDEAIADNEYCWIRFEADPMSVAADEDEIEALANTAAEDAILKSYDENHHGLYIPSDEHVDEPVDEKVLARESYKWIREYVKNPTPAVEPENNFFFIQTENAIYYSTYQLRLHLSKRVKTRTDAAEDEVASRPSTLSLHVMAGEFEEDGGTAQAETAEGEDGEEQTEEQTEEAAAADGEGETADGDAQAPEAEGEATMESETTEGGEEAAATEETMETTESGETATE